MIIKGTFDPSTGRPYLQGLLAIMSLNKMAYIDFLVDTGADATTLNPGDGRRMGIDYHKLSYTDPTFGVGSLHRDAALGALVVFQSQEGTYPGYRIRLSITPYDVTLEPLPSLLGTDILRRWDIHWNYTQDILDFQVITSDIVLPQGLFS